MTAVYWQQGEHASPVDRGGVAPGSEKPHNYPAESLKADQTGHPLPSGHQG